MASVHSKVTILAFNGLNTGWQAHDFLCAGGGLIERHAHLLETTTYLPGEDTYAS